jgi:hypothetical protein
VGEPQGRFAGRALEAGQVGPSLPAAAGQ